MKQTVRCDIPGNEVVVHFIRQNYIIAQFQDLAIPVSAIGSIKQRSRLARWVQF